MVQITGEQVIHGIDVSHYQGEIDWEQVKQNEPPIDFVYIKATQSSHEVDPNFEKNWSGAGNASILRGAYHFFNAKADAKAEADYFIDIVKKLEPNDLPPWLDLEGGVYSAVDEVSKQDYIAGVLTWLAEVEKGLGIRPIIYASPDFAGNHLTDERLGVYLLAVAQYQPGLNAPKMAGAWQGKTWTFWQYSETGKIKGINGSVDMDRFNGSSAELLKIAVNTGN